ncbi:antiterminator Q family protein [Vreelandella aquamarina]|uniref:antiterminator Q family protein n=1 Tax=Vreelandella aquamarina TaxID=77097 RepID=UPI000783B7A6|nr:antiterminator Q family protein [Halomonas axialensis]
MSINKQTINLLSNWGKWIRQGKGVPRCTTQMECILRDVEPCAEKDPMRITDDDALMIDSIIARLLKRDPEMGGVLSEYYSSHDQSMRAISRMFDMPRTRVERLLASGEAWVDGVLEARHMIAA